MRLNHLSEFRDVKRGKRYLAPFTVAGRKLYRVEKNGTPMTFIFALGNHVIDIRDAAHLFADDLLPYMRAPDVAQIVVMTVLDKAEKELRFPLAKRPAFLGYEAARL